MRSCGGQNQEKRQALRLYARVNLRKFMGIRVFLLCLLTLWEARSKAYFQVYDKCVGEKVQDSSLVWYLNKEFQIFYFFPNRKMNNMCDIGIRSYLGCLKSFLG